MQRFGERGTRRLPLAGGGGIFAGGAGRNVDSICEGWKLDSGEEARNEVIVGAGLENLVAI